MDLKKAYGRHPEHLTTNIKGRYEDSKAALQTSQGGRGGGEKSMRHISDKPAIYPQVLLVLNSIVKHAQEVPLRTIFYTRRRSS